MKPYFIYVGLPGAKPSDWHIVGVEQIMGVNKHFKLKKMMHKYDE